MKRQNILILGYGEMGHAMEYLLRARHTIRIWEKWPKAGFQSAKLEESAAGADVVLFCLPVNPHRPIITQIKPLLRKESMCVSIAKGLDEAGETAAQIFADVLGSERAYALMYGPMISEEIRAGRHAFAQLGGRHYAVFESMRDVFIGSRLYLEYTVDIPGISWSVILKNVYAMLFGMADEMQLGDNMRGYLAVTALSELDRIVRNMGGQAGSSYHLAGLGDLITTATSEDSHHHELGRRLARGETQGIAGEGVHTLRMVSQHHLFKVADYPLFSLLQAIVDRPCDGPQHMETYLKKL